MAGKVKIFEIAKRIGIPSSELVALCRRAGFAHIKHHSNAVEAGEAEDIRKAAIRLYRPPAPPPPKKKKVAVGKKKAAGKKAAASGEAAGVKETKPTVVRRVTASQAKGKDEGKAETAVKAAPSGEDVKPVAPPKPKRSPRARQTWAEARRSAERQKVAGKETARPAPASVTPLPSEEPGWPGKRQRRPKRKREKQEEYGKAAGPRIRTRTVTFKQIHKPAAKKRESKIELTPPVSVRDLSERLGVSASEIIRKLMTEHEVRANINEVLDQDVVETIGMDYEVEITFKEKKTSNQLLDELVPEGKPEDMQPRAPIVALLGHVDHGKTSILDRIRKADVAGTEVAGTEDGGITQDIGAWQIDREGHRLTFIDTPGHEAFTAMRAHGAHVTDLVVLVVAADDGVMPQTEEAISHAKAAGVPIVVALNKVDKPDANPMRVLQQLAGHGINTETWGGEVGCVEVSALTGLGIDDLLERIILEAEIHELRADPNRPAVGAVLEARMVQGLGAVANVIVQDGTLRLGDLLVAGGAWGRIRSIVGEHGVDMAEAGPASAVAVSGLDGLPTSGDRFAVLDDQDLAREIAARCAAEQQEARLRPRHHVTLENLYESLAAGREKHLRVIVKADVEGSLEPIVTSFQRIGTDEVSVRMLHQGVGAVNTSDVLLADASDAVIVAFRVGVETRAETLVKETGVEVRYYRVIYAAVQEVRDALEGLLEPDVVEEKIGEAEVRQTFKVSRLGTIAGCYVRSGQFRRNARTRLLRDGVVVHEGAIGSLRREKDDVREVEGGYECGIKLDGYDDLQVGDTIECFVITEVKRVLS